MRLCILTCLLFVYSLVFAQSKRLKSTTGMVYWGFGYQYQSFGNLSNRISNQPLFEKPGSNMANIFVGINKETSGFIRDFQVHFGASTKGNDEKRNTSLMSGGGAFTVGYNFSKKATFRIYPFVGVSGEGYYAKFNRDVSAVSFDSILVSNTVQQRTEPVTLNNMYFCYQGGLAIDFINTKYRFLRSLGLRTSYTGSFKSRTWRVNENQLIANAPNDRISQFNGSLLFAFGSKRSNKMMF